MTNNIPRTVLSFDSPFVKGDVLDRIMPPSEFQSAERSKLESRIRDFLQTQVADGSLWKSGAEYEVRIRPVL